jgi:anti-sigma factor RsiW
MSRRLGGGRSGVPERDLARLADGTLSARRRELLERAIAHSPELQERLSEQRRAVVALRFAAQRERAPVALRMQRRALRTRARRGPWALVVALAAPAAALVTIFALLASGEPSLTVAQAATLAARPALMTVGEPPEDSARLPGLRAAGLPFPYWEDRFGWQATGARTDRIDGRSMTTVFYRRGDRRIAYTIVSGRPLATGASTFTTPGGQRVVTWLRRGHTCVLSGRDVPLRALLALAAWRAHGRIPF